MYWKQNNNNKYIYYELLHQNWEGHNSTHNSPSLKQNSIKKCTYRNEMKNILRKTAAKTMISATR